jgi:predicted transcriptional regulator
MMNTLTIGISNASDVSARFLTAWETHQPQPASISFASEELLWKTLTLKRWAVLKAMCGAGELTIREVARRLNRDIKAVHSDMQLLLQCGLVDKTKTGKVIFPYDALHVDFMLQAV